jgi:hypothetical protein
MDGRTRRKQDTMSADKVPGWYLTTLNPLWELACRLIPIIIVEKSDPTIGFSKELTGDAVSHTGKNC